MLFFPVLNAWADNTGYQGSGPFTSTLEQLKDIAAYYSDASELHAYIDGVAVQNLSDYRAGYAPFSYTVPATDNLLQLFGGFVPRPDGVFIDWPSPYVTGAASDGYWLMLKPLPPGTHTISFGGTAKNTGFQINITYTITVVPKGQF